MPARQQRTTAELDALVRQAIELHEREGLTAVRIAERLGVSARHLCKSAKARGYSFGADNWGKVDHAEIVRAALELQAKDTSLTARGIAEPLGLTRDQVKEAFRRTGQSLPRPRRHPPRPKPSPKRATAGNNAAARKPPARPRTTSLSRKFTPEEQAAIAEAVAAGRVTRIEQGEFEDTARLIPWRRRPRASRNGGEWHRARAVRRRAADALEV